MKIKGYLKTSLIEWPGKVSAVVYTSGCNFRCPFCHNRDLVDPKRILELKDITNRFIFDDLKIRKKWVDAVIITGGEPTIHPDLDKFLAKIKKMDFLTMLETNGSGPERLEELFKAGLLDRIAMDVKGPLNERYEEIIQNLSSKNKIVHKIKKSIELILKSGIEYEFRTTIVPGIHDVLTLGGMANDLKQLSRFQEKQLNWVLQNFQPKNCLNKSFEKVKPYSKNELKELIGTVETILPGTTLRESFAL